jgi:F420-dependent oxidoreductase-like protein
MRIGLLVGPERGKYAEKVERLQAMITWAEEAGFSSVWLPQIPDEFEVFAMAALAGLATSTIEIGTAVVPIQPRHPVALAQQALSIQAICKGRFTLGLGVSHHWIIEEMMGIPYGKPATAMSCYLDVLEQAFAGPGMVDVEDELFTIHQPFDITDSTRTPILLAALGPRMLKMAGGRADGTSLWLADERAIATHIVPAITKAAEEAGRPAPRVLAGIPVCLCKADEVDAAVEQTNRILSEAEISPNYQKLLDMGDASSIGDIAAVGDEAAVERRLRRYADAGVTDISSRVVPMGSNREESKASAQRTREFLASLQGSI